MRKLLVANRGEIACRVLRSAKTLGLATVAVYSEADAQSLHVKRADEAILIGPAKASESYLDVERVLGAARKSEAEAIHPGYGFLSENAGFAQRVLDSGLTWIGPKPAQIRDMGDKERARGIAEIAGVPVLSGSQRFLAGEIDGIFEAGDSVGYPLLVKAAAGGGGIGMRLVEQPDQLEAVASQLLDVQALQPDEAAPDAVSTVSSLLDSLRECGSVAVQFESLLSTDAATDETARLGALESVRALSPARLDCVSATEASLYGVVLDHVCGSEVKLGCEWRWLWRVQR